MTVPKSRLRAFVPGIVLVLAAITGLALVWRQGTRDGREREQRPAAPVAVAPIERGAITVQRTFTGALEAHSSFVAAPKVGGRVEAITVDIGDEVRRGQMVARLDDAEFVQDVAQAEADLAVARANLAEARSLEDIAVREIERLAGLRDDGFTSQSQFETAEAQRLARAAQLKVAEAQITRAESALESARIRLGYTRVAAEWERADDERVVAERFVDEGDTVSANTPLLRIVDIERMIAVIFVTERDYAQLRPGQSATFTTDTFPGETFTGEIARVAPYFREATRQARVELLIANPDRRLKPGMFIRATLTLARVADTTIVPEAALTRRRDITGVFILNEESRTVHWHPVQTGVREVGRVEVFGEGLTGRVVVLGHQLVDDGSLVTLPQDGPDAKAP